MKIEEKVWNKVVKRLEFLRTQNEIHDAAARAIMLPPESPITNPLGHITEVAIAAIADTIGASDWLSYFIWECDYGQSIAPKTVTIKAQTRAIRGYDDIRWVIENY